MGPIILRMRVLGPIVLRIGSWGPLYYVRVNGFGGVPRSVEKSQLASDMKP